jgi:threonine dehydrogenase-like Zn-dependent dehydrogenase
VRGDAAALAQPMAIAQHAITRGRPAAGERALILGAGGIGTFATWAALGAGIDVTVCDRKAGKLGVVGSFGDVRTVHCADAPVGELLADDGPWDVIYEMTGAQEPLAAAIALVRPGGRIVVAGVQKGQPPVDMVRLALQEVELLGTMAHVRRDDLPRALELLGSRTTGWADVAPLVHPLEAVQPALEALAGGGTSSVKTLVDPSLGAPRPFAG